MIDTISLWVYLNATPIFGILAVAGLCLWINYDYIIKK